MFIKFCYNILIKTDVYYSGRHYGKDNKQKTDYDNPESAQLFKTGYGSVYSMVIREG